MRSSACIQKVVTMPKIRSRQDLQQLRGTMLDVMLKLSPRSGMTAARRPDMSNVRWSEAQKVYRETLKQAAAYASAALAESSVRRLYERRAQRQGKRAWDLALSDYFEGKDLLQK